MEGKRESQRNKNRATAKVSEPIDPFPLTLSAFPVVPRPSETQQTASVLFFHPGDRIPRWMGCNGAALCSSFTPQQKRKDEKKSERKISSNALCVDAGEKRKTA